MSRRQVPAVPVAPIAFAVQEQQPSSFSSQ
jgi:hypothetical protein